MARLRCPLFCLSMLLLLALAAAQRLLPQQARSDMENRPLAQFAAPNWQAIRTGRWMEDTETAVADQFPARDAWMQLQALTDTALLRTERNGILLGRDGWLFESGAQWNTRALQANLDAMDALAEQTDIPVTVMVVPVSSAVYPQHLPRWTPPSLAQAGQDATAGMQHADTIDILPGLQAHEGGKPLYYRTDHHWTDAGAEIGYQALLDAWGISAADHSAPLAASDGFYGTYFARAPSPLIRGDDFTFSAPPDITLTIDGVVREPLYDPVQLTQRDKYASLLWGNHGRITLESGSMGGTLLVIKDSYANALLPRLAQHFGRIVAIDPRYYLGDLNALITETEATRILCLYGQTTLLTDRSLLLLTADFAR